MTASKQDKPFSTLQRQSPVSPRCSPEPQPLQVPYKRTKAVSILPNDLDWEITIPKKKKKTKQRFIRRVGRKQLEDLGETIERRSGQMVHGDFDNIFEDVEEQNYHLSYGSDLDMNILDTMQASAALDRLQLSEKQRKQIEIATNLENCIRRVKEALVYAGEDTNLNVKKEKLNKLPNYSSDCQLNSTSEVAKNKIEVDKLVDLLKNHEVYKNLLMRDIEGFLNLASVDKELSEMPLARLFDTLEEIEEEERIYVEGFNDAVKYTEYLGERLAAVGDRLLREAGIIYSSSEEEADEECGDFHDTHGKGTKNAAIKKKRPIIPPELRYIENPATYQGNTQLLQKCLEDTLHMVKNRIQKKHVREMIKMYEGQIKAVQHWLTDLRKMDESKKEAKEKVAQMVSVRDAAIRGKEMLNLELKRAERQCVDLEIEVKRLHNFNDNLNARNRKLENDIEMLEEKMDSMKDNVMISTGFREDKTEVKVIKDPKDVALIQNLRNDIARHESTITDLEKNINTLKQELQDEQGRTKRLKAEMGMLSRPQSRASPLERAPSQPPPSSPSPQPVNSTDDTKAEAVHEELRKAQAQINDLKLELNEKSKEVEMLDELTNELRSELKGILKEEVSDDNDDRSTAHNITAPDACSNTTDEYKEEDNEDDADYKANQAGNAKKELENLADKQNPVHYAQMHNLRRAMRIMQMDHQAEKKKLLSHLQNEKSRTEAEIRKSEQSNKEIMSNNHNQAVEIVQNINRCKTTLAALLEKESLEKVSNELQSIPDIATEEIAADPTEVMSHMTTQITTVMMGIEKCITQAILTIQLDNKDKVTAAQLANVNLKNEALLASRQDKTREAEELVLVRQELEIAKAKIGQVKKREEAKYQKLYSQYKNVWNSSANLQQDFNQFQQDFVEALCNKEVELQDTQTSLKDVQIQLNDSKKLISSLNLKINAKLDYWDEHVCIKAEDVSRNLRVLHKAVAENKISYLVHSMTVNMIKQMMDLPLLRLKSIFKRYIRMRRFKQARVDLEKSLEELDEEDPEQGVILQDYQKFIGIMDKRLERRNKLWHSEVKHLEDKRRFGWIEFCNIWEGLYNHTNFLNLSEQDLAPYIGRCPRVQVKDPEKQKKKKLDITKARDFLRGLRLPMLDPTSQITGQQAITSVVRDDMWTNPEDQRKGLGNIRIETPRLTELEYNRPMRNAFKSVQNIPKRMREVMPLHPAEPYDFADGMPRRISKKYHDTTVYMDSKADLHRVIDIPFDVLRMHRQSIAIEADIKREEARLPKQNIGAELE